MRYWRHLSTNFNQRTREECDDEGSTKTHDAVLFQSTHPWRVRPKKTLKKRPFTYFNQRTREECDLKAVSTGSFVSRFQSTHPWRVRLVGNSVFWRRLIFQSTHPWRVRRGSVCKKECSRVYFNQRTREECDGGGTDCPQNKKSISINAPVKSATRLLALVRHIKLHFNQRTREECDYPVFAACLVCRLFQSTHPWRVRLKNKMREMNKAYISINAPVKSATAFSLKFWRLAAFQSTHPWRVRLELVSINTSSNIFQSTHPWRVRLCACACRQNALCISINAPVKSATNLNKISAPYNPTNFNQRTREECDE